MDTLIKAAAAGVCGAIIALVIKKNSPETAMLLTLALSVMVVWLSLGVVESLIEFTQGLADTAGISTAILTPVFKTVGIGVITKLAADVCRDAGQASIASSVELAGSAAALYVALPLMQSVFSLVRGLL